MQNDRRAWVVLVSLGLLVLCLSLGAQEQTAPKFKFDPDWPKPLPNKWKMGGVTGLAVDKDDNVWVLDRPNDLTDIELEAELTPPLADCCVRPPSMIHIDKNGNVIGSFDPPQGHGMAVDSKGFVYIGQDTVRKYDPKTGKLVAEVPRTPDKTAGRWWSRCPSHVSPRSGPRQRRAGCRISHATRRAPSTRSRGAGGSRGGDSGLPRQVSADDADDRGRNRRDSARRTSSRTLRRRQLPGRARDGVRLGHVRSSSEAGAPTDTHCRKSPPMTRTAPILPAGPCPRSSGATSR